MIDSTKSLTPVEYTPEAIDDRFRQLDAISKLAVSLREAGIAARAQAAMSLPGLSANPAQAPCFSANAIEHEQR